MIRLVVTAVYIVSGFHAFFGLLSMCVGVISSIKAEVWLAHRVSPIWSGGFFFITGILGVLCARRKSSYVIMCFTAFSVVSLVTAVVSIQLLRLGLVNHTTDGHTFQKENKDILIFVALATAGSECLVCLISSVLSCRIAKVAKEELCKQREGMFHVKDDTDDAGENSVATLDCPMTTENQAVDSQLLDEVGIELDIMSPRTAERTKSERPIFDVSDYVHTMDQMNSDVNEDPTDFSIAKRYTCRSTVNLLLTENDRTTSDSNLPSIQS